MRPLPLRWLTPLLALCLGCADPDAPPALPDDADSDAPTPADLAQPSAPRYDDNAAGLITPNTLGRWLADWSAARPAGASGDLIVLQLDPADDPAPFLSPSPGVRVYHAPDLTRLLQTRSNGLLAIGRVPARGLLIDSFLRQYNIRPDQDLVLLAAGQGSPARSADLASAWLALRYWGFEHRALAILNAPISSLPADQRQPDAATPPANGSTRISSLRRDHRALLADLSLVQRAARDQRPLIDARPLDQLQGRVLSPSPAETSCLAKAPRCTAAFAGRIAGAKHLPPDAIINPDGSFKDPQQLAAALAAADIDPSQPQLAYDADGSSSALVTFALLAILDVPARWYAASFIEWGSLHASHPDPALRSLPEQSPWRADRIPDLTVQLDLWADADTIARPIILDPNADSTDKIQQEDLQYINNPPALPPVGGGGNDCITR